MNEHVERLAAQLVSEADELASEFDARVADSSALAFRIAYSVLRNRADAEDVAQEAFVRAHRRLASLRDRDRFRAWLVRITWRLALDWKRGARRRGTREDVVARASRLFADAETEMVANDRAARLWVAIDTLPEKLRIVVVLAAIEGHGVQDVAALTGVPAGTVKSRLFEARKRLLEKLR
jgi:RNA polymerase sigma-70 factor (ECF subfamily)